METMNDNAPVSGSFQPCAEFRSATNEAPVCGCGWLDTEHERRDAEVHDLPVRRAQRATPKRLAS